MATTLSTLLLMAMAMAEATDHLFLVTKMHLQILLQPILPLQQIPRHQSTLFSPPSRIFHPLLQSPPMMPTSKMSMMVLTTAVMIMLTMAKMTELTSRQAMPTPTAPTWEPTPMAQKTSAPPGSKRAGLASLARRRVSARRYFAKRSSARKRASA
ncbi:hypothetical protein IWX91DRAFT_348196 [Phyllosticta citricarpa]